MIIIWDVKLRRVAYTVQEKAISDIWRWSSIGEQVDGQRLHCRHRLNVIIIIIVIINVIVIIIVIVILIIIDERM